MSSIPRDLSQPAAMAELTHAFSELGQRRPEAIHLLVAELGWGRRRVDVELPLPVGVSSELWSRYLVARLHNILTIVSPQRIVLRAPIPLQTMAQAALQHLMDPRQGHGVVTAMAGRMHHRPVRCDLGEPPDHIRTQSADLGQWPPGPGPTRSHRRVEDVLAEVEGLVVGVDLGGTDVKLVAADRTGIVLLMEHVWAPPPRRFSHGSEFHRAIGRLVRFLLAKVALDRRTGLSDLKERTRRLVKEPHSPLAEKIQAFQDIQAAGITPVQPVALGISFPDVVARDLVVGGMTSKYAAIRRRYQSPGGAWRDQPGYWLEFDREIRPLARRVSDDLARTLGSPVPVRVVNDGTAGALWAAETTGYPGALALSLGTSLAGGKVDRQNRPAPGMYEVGNALLFIGDDRFDAYRHRSLGLPGSAQQALSQDAVFRLAVREGILPNQPVDQEAATLQWITSELLEEQPETVERIYRGLAEHLCLGLMTMRNAGADLESVVLFGRVVRGEAGGLLIDQAQRLIEERPLLAPLRAISLLRASQLSDPDAPDGATDLDTLAQAIGAVYLAVS